MDQFLTEEAPNLGPVLNSTAYMCVYIYISLSLSLSLSLAVAFSQDGQEFLSYSCSCSFNQPRFTKQPPVATLKLIGLLQGLAAWPHGPYGHTPFPSKALAFWPHCLWQQPLPLKTNAPPRPQTCSKHPCQGHPNRDPHQILQSFDLVFP